MRGQCRTARSRAVFTDPGYARGMALPEHRASDAEREAAADRLRVAAGDGRLDPDELEQRLEQAYAARTVGELTELTRDLPAPRAPVRRDWASPAGRARRAGFFAVNPPRVPRSAAS